MILCALLPDSVPPAFEEMLLEAAPRVALEPPYAWLDVRGLDPLAVHASLRRRVPAVRSGAAASPITAQVAARSTQAGEHTSVPPGAERAFLTAHTLDLLGVGDPLLGWLADVGIATCGELAAQEREAVEVRFGAEAVHWWKLARGIDERCLFLRVPPEQPHASIDFVDYVVTDPERLIFTTNALLGGLCEQMRERGTHARRVRLRLPLANGTCWERSLKTARPTADRSAWLRLARGLLERITVPDAVIGVHVQVESTEPAAAMQGDLFDAGFATASAVEGAVARLLEDQGEVIVEPVTSAHPLVEQRNAFEVRGIHEVLRQERSQTEVPIGLTLQLLSEPRPIVVETIDRRDHVAPVRYRDGQWQRIVHAAGPDRVSGGQWDAHYAREYFRAVTGSGTLVWLFRDAAGDRWYLHGWWD